KHDSYALYPLLFPYRDVFCSVSQINKVNNGGQGKPSPYILLVGSTFKLAQSPNFVGTMPALSVI
ncbi:MAG: hypothetical protein AAF126_18040, partial [Chloroflexota bacterium]